MGYSLMLSDWHLVRFFAGFAFGAHCFAWHAIAVIVQQLQLRFVEHCGCAEAGNSYDKSSSNRAGQSDNNPRVRAINPRLAFNTLVT